MSEKVLTFNVPFTEAEFVDDVRSNGFLAKSIEIAIPAYVNQHQAWFDHAERLNVAGQAAFNCRDNVVVGLSSHSAKAIATRTMIRSMSTFQATILLLRRGMAAEADTLIRGLYETAFWLGFLLKDEAGAVRSIVVDELHSQIGLFGYYIECAKSGMGRSRELDVSELEKRIAENRVKLGQDRPISIKNLAKKSGLYLHYDAYKIISASAAHTSLNSLHRHMKVAEPGSYDGHIFGPDMEAAGAALQRACISFGLVVAHYATITGPGDNDDQLQELLVKTDALRRTAA